MESDPIIWFVLLAAMPAVAGRPFATEDAAVLADNACQVEAWVDRSREATQSWFVPACNFGRGIEWQVGFARTHEHAGDALSESYFQAKSVLWSSEESPWAAGLVAGVTRKPQRETHRGWENPYLTVPISIATSDATLHFAVGWSQDRAERRNITTWGVAAERAITPRVTILAEAYGENAQRPFLRAGGRVNAIKDALDFDLTVVTRPGGTRAERFVSLGLVWQKKL